LLVAMLLSIALASMGFVQSASNTKILIDPTVSTAGVTETFWIDVNIEAVEDLYAWQIKIQYSPGTRVVGAIAVEEGTFLFGPDGTAMAYSINGIQGIVDIGQTILGDWPGTSGSGLLCRVQFAVTEAGESDLILFDTVLLDSSLNEISHQTRDGSFDGANTELVMIEIGARAKDVGQTAVFNAKVRNADQKSAVLGAKVRFDFTNTMTGRTTSLWSGQSYEYPPIREPITLHVNNYTAERQQWTEVGASPFLDAPDDGNEIVGSSDGAQHRWFTFEDIELGDSVVDEVRLWVYCEGPVTEDVDYDVYAPGFNWLGSYYGEGVGNRVWQDQPRWAGGAIASEMYPALLTEEGVNGFEALCYYYDPTHVGEGTDIIDAMYLEITFKVDRVALPINEPVYDIQPGEVTWLEPLVWPLQPEDVGEYTCTVTCFYTYLGYRFNKDVKVITEHFRVDPAKK